MKVKGIGQAKAITISAALELGRRRQASSSLQKKLISSSNDIADYFMAKLKDYRHEVFAVVFLNRANKINHFEIVSEGGITGTVADPRVILKKALEEDAVSTGSTAVKVALLHSVSAIPRFPPICRAASARASIRLRAARRCATTWERWVR